MIRNMLDLAKRSLVWHRSMSRSRLEGILSELLVR